MILNDDTHVVTRQAVTGVTTPISAGSWAPYNPWSGPSLQADR